MIVRTQTPPEDFADAARTLRDEYGIDPLIDPDCVTDIANLYPHMTVQEVADCLGVDRSEHQRWTPEKMQRRIDELEALPA